MNRGARKLAYDSESKQQSNVWVFYDEPNPTKVARARSTYKQMIACFSEKTGYVAIVPLEKRRTVKSEWYTTIFLPVIIQETTENQMSKTNHSSPQQYELSHIGSNNCIFEHSEHRFDKSFFSFPYVKNKIRG